MAIPYPYALFGQGRFGATRFGYHSPYVYVSINGQQLAFNRDVSGEQVDYAGGLTITDVLNDTPNTAEMVVSGFVPAAGMEIIIQLGSSSTKTKTRLFAGHVLKVGQVQVSAASIPHYPISCIDYTWRLHNAPKVLKQYTNQSATDIVIDLIATYAPAFTTRHVAAGLPTIDLITFTNEDLDQAITRVMDRIGGYWYCDYFKDIHAFEDAEVTNGDPVALTTSHPSLTHFSFQKEDKSEEVNRVVMDGGGVNALTAVAAGETILPVPDVAWYSALGGELVSGPQPLTYTGLDAGGGGSLVGIGVSPTAAPTVIASPGAGVEAGVHDYAFTWVTASGETLPSPLAAVTLGFSDPPNDGPGISGITSGGSLGIGIYKYAVTFVTASGETSPSPVRTSGVPTSSGFQTIIVSPIPTGPAGTTQRKLYRTVVDGTQQKLLATLADNTTTFYNDGTADGSLGADIPTSNTATAQQAALSSIAVGPTGTTSRKVYRTVAAGSQLKLLTTISDNTTLVYTDSTADASLGANVPTGDTSLLAIETEDGQGFYTTGPVFPTDGAATTATTTPVFSSASYNFVSADVGAILYIKSGTNWTAGRYTIVSVGSNKATLDRACASVASPTAATWGVDYSEMTSARFDFTDLVIGAATTQFTSAAHPVGKNFIGNALIVKSGLGFFRQRVIITATSGTTATVDKILGTATVTGGIGSLGGAPNATTVNPGATSVPCASLAAFGSGGGWAVIGNGQQVIRYTGLSASALTGVPASGAGAIAAAITYGSTITGAPQLTGIPASGDGSIVYDIKSGDPVNIRVTVNAEAAQAAVAALLGYGDGITVEHLQDGRMSLAEITARAAATLALRQASQEIATYTVRDDRTRTGKDIAISFSSPTSISTSLKIQRVTVTNFTHSQLPDYQVQASSDRFSFEDLLRLVKGKAS